MNFINLELTLTLAYMFYILLIITHILIIYKKIPHTLVNGGRSTSYENQASISKTSIIISIIGLVFLSLSLFGDQVYKNIIYSVVAFVLSAYWLLGFVMQLLGTKFEKYVMSFLVIVGFLSHLMLGLLRFVEAS